MCKTSGNVFLGYLGEWIFHIFPRFYSIMWGAPSYILEVSWIMLQYSVQAICIILRWSSFDKKIGNSWKLLLIVVTESFILNVMRLLDPTLKHKDKFRLQSDSLSPSKKNCDIFFNESPLKMITNAFYFIFISFSGYLIFFLTFWPSRKNGLIRNIKLISKFMISQPG